VSSDVVKLAGERISAFIEHFVSEPLSRGLNYLGAIRNDDGAWGRVRGSVSEVRTTSIALKVFVKNRSRLKYGEFEDGLQYLRNHLPFEAVGPLSSTNPRELRATLVEDVALATSLILLAEQDEQSTFSREASKYFTGRQNEDGGWGEGTSQVDTTASVLLAMGSLKQKSLANTIRKGVVYLENSTNPDGGWGLSQGTLSSVTHTAKALLALTLVDRENPVIDKAVRYLTSNQNSQEGSWGQDDQSDVVYATGITLKALVHALNEKNDEHIHKGIRFLMKNQRAEGGWGWAIGDITEAEPTAVVIDGLFDAGITEYVPVSTSVELLKGALEEINEARIKTQLLEKDIDGQVQLRITNIIETRDKLDQRVKELETENKRLSRQQPELEKLRSELFELQNLRSDQLQVQDILEDAISILSGRQNSPEETLTNLETLIAKSNLHKNGHAVEVITRMLRVRGEISAAERDNFSRSFLNALSNVTPLAVAQRIVSYVMSLPMTNSSELEPSIRKLLDRLERGTVRVQATKRKRKSFSFYLSNLENHLTNLALRDRSSYDEVLDNLIRYLPDLSEESTVSFTDFISKKVNFPDMAPKIKKALTDVIKNKNGREQAVKDWLHRLPSVLITT
jgi:prenyltransferase beta subunit